MTVSKLLRRLRWGPSSVPPEQFHLSSQVVKESRKRLRPSREHGGAEVTLTELNLRPRVMHRFGHFHRLPG